MISVFSLRRIATHTSFASFQSLSGRSSQRFSQFGDFPDYQTSFRALAVRSASSSMRISSDSHSMQVYSMPDDFLIARDSFRFHNNMSMNELSPTSPLEADIVSPLSIDAVLYHLDGGKIEVQKLGLGERLQCVSTLAHLAVFGILGVLLRYGLEVLFGPNHAAIVSEESVLYIDLPANVLGSFLMGWFGFVLKPIIVNYSESLSIGLTTGFLGSLTTFSGWIQKMINLAAKGQWDDCLVGLFISMVLSIGSLVLGVYAAKGTMGLVKKATGEVVHAGPDELEHFKCRTHLGCWLSLIVLTFIWGFGIIFISLHFESIESTKVLLACIFGPPGVWLRWYLAKRNGQGFGPDERMKWLPIGTLIANVSAVGVMGALSTASLVIKSDRLILVIKAVQLGFLGCLSTVSTFVAEVYALLLDDHPDRATIYVLLSIFLSLVVDILVFYLPVMLNGSLSRP